MLVFFGSGSWHHAGDAKEPSAQQHSEKVRVLRGDLGAKGQSEAGNSTLSCPHGNDQVRPGRKHDPNLPRKYKNRTRSFSFYHFGVGERAGELLGASLADGLL